MVRIDKENYYLDIAETVLERGTCLRRNFGAIIVNNDQIVSTGYVGAPRGRKNCIDLGHCVRETNNIPRGERYELCRSVHAEQNAILYAVKNSGSVEGSTLYVTLAPCLACARIIYSMGIAKVVFMYSYAAYKGLPEDEGIVFLNTFGVQTEQYGKEILFDDALI